MDTRLYYPGAGGTIFYIDNPDSTSHGAPVHQVFYTTLANYQANASAFNSTVFINTPITADASGNVFFGFRVQGTAPAPLNTTQSGFARIDPNGNATLTTSSLSVASHSITATYNGSSSFSPSTSSVLTQVVNQDGTTSVVTSSLNPSRKGQNVTFTATVTANSPGAAVPTGAVTFKNGSSTLGTKTLNSSGQATLSTSGLNRGNHSITVVYRGSSSFLGSTSPVLTQTVN